mmetsp:Transcript_21501/g.48973  ORF Transcript_21501/g.48973 Transcript_21501/m.48973 type:complete len:329 (-) Transcript_21501:1071-2057(-)
MSCKENELPKEREGLLHLPLMPGAREADPRSGTGVVDGVVPSQYRLAKDEDLRPQGRRQVHRHEHGLAHVVLSLIGVLGDEGPHPALRPLLDQGVVPRLKSHRDALELDVELRSGARALLSLRRVEQKLEELWEDGRWHCDQRRPSVHDGAAAPVPAELDGLAIVDSHGLDLHHPLAQRRVVDRVPGDILLGFRRRVASEGDLALFVVVLRQEDREHVWVPALRLHGHRGDDVHRIELRRLGQTIEPEAQHAIELEVVEGVLGHVGRRDHAQAHAVAGELSAPLRDDGAARGDAFREAVVEDPLARSGGVAEADHVLDEDSGDLARAE